MSISNLLIKLGKATLIDTAWIINEAGQKGGLRRETSTNYRWQELRQIELEATKCVRCRHALRYPLYVTNWSSDYSKNITHYIKQTQNNKNTCRAVGFGDLKRTVFASNFSLINKFQVKLWRCFPYFISATYFQTKVAIIEGYQFENIIS